MIKYRPEDFVLFEDSVNNDSIYAQEDVENLGWWYIEKESCILVDLKIKDNKMVDPNEKDVEISEKDLAKGQILKLFCKKLFKYLGDSNPLLKKYQLSILDDAENSFVLHEKNGLDNFYIYLLRTGIDVNLKENRCDYLRIDLKDEPEDVNDYLRWLFTTFEWHRFRELFKYSPVVTEEKYVTRIDPDEEFDKILSKTWNEVRDSQEYKQLISNYE